MTKLICTNSDHDEITHYLQVWCQPILKEAEDRRIGVHTLEGKEDTRTNFEREMKSYRPTFVFLNGHGSESAVNGFISADETQCEKILDKENASITENKIVYARACASAQKLGGICITEGATAYVGYLVEFALVWDPNLEATPLEDEIAKPFMVSSNAIPEALIKGNSVSEALRKSKEQMRKQIHHYERITSDEGPSIVPYLFLNMLSTTALGNLDAKL